MEPTQPPIQQPVQIPVEVPIPLQPKPNYLKTVIFFVLTIISLSLITYLIFQNQKLQKQVLNPQISPTIQFPSPTPQTVSSISIPSNEITGWRTYTNLMLGFSFKYPDEYKDPIENNNYISLMSPLNSGPKKGYELQNGELKVEIYTSDASFDETLIDLVKKKKEQSDSLGSNTKILKEEEILIDGINAVKQTWEGMGTGQTILFIRNGKEFGIIKYPAVTSRDDEFDQILSTFKFVNSPTSGINDSCVTSGCSNELCVEKSNGGRATICLYRDEYACYKNATCERQSDGKCGWTQTKELKSCLSKFK